MFLINPFGNFVVVMHKFDQKKIYRDTISAMPGKITEYDDNMTRIAVTEVKILSEEKISVTLFGTVTVEVEI